MRVFRISGFSLFVLVFLGTGISFAGGDFATITDGPVLGRLDSDGIGIWARTSVESTFYVRFGEDPKSLDRISKPVKTRVAHDNTGWAHIRDLTPDTKYYYRVEVENTTLSDPLLGGSFRTLPTAQSRLDPETNPDGLFNFSFEYACGNAMGPNSRHPTFKVMLERLKDKVSFAIQNGDWIYEVGRDYTVGEWRKQLSLSRKDTPSIVDLAPSIVGVWENYKIFHEWGRDTVGAWHREVPSFFTFDDHEIMGDVNGTGSIGLVAPKPVFRDIAVQSWEDYLGWSNPNPRRQKIHFGEGRFTEGSDILTNPEGSFNSLDLDEMANLMVHWGGQMAGDKHTVEDIIPNPNAGVYEVIEVIDDSRLRIQPAARADGVGSYSIGQLSYFKITVSNCDFFVLDTRSHRQMHNIENPFDPSVSLLGRKQKAWLKESMRESHSDFLFVVSSVNLMIPHVANTIPGEKSPESPLFPEKDEAWTALTAEREEMITFWDSLEKPVLVLTGDIHNSFAIKITDRVWEFASGPHTSVNHRAVAESNRPPNGLFVSRKRPCDIRWSTYFHNDSPKSLRLFPVYCVVQINNVFSNPKPDGTKRWIAFPRPQVVFQFYSGLNGDLLYAESIAASREKKRL